jgi:hypothetical protein
MKVHGLTEYKLTDLDWEILNALYAVLAISLSPGSDSSAAYSTHCIGSLYGSANHVSRIDASALRSCSVLQNLHDPMEKLCSKYPELKPWVNIGLKWAKKYYNHMDNTDTHMIAMCELLLSSLSYLNMN